MVDKRRCMRLLSDNALCQVAVLSSACIGHKWISRSK
jgi:hypothetical protein